MARKKKETRTVSIRFPIHIFEELQRRAERDTRSLSEQINHYVKIVLNNEATSPTEQRVEGGENDEMEIAK